MSYDQTATEQTLAAARAKLLSARVPAGYWEGELSSSALSTATAIAALALFRNAGSDCQLAAGAPLDQVIGAGFTWLDDHQNADGGWGDTTDSPSNISTTTLCWAALALADSGNDRLADLARRAERWLTKLVGRLTPSNLSHAITQAYGKDRTFAVPILTVCALTGRFGSGRNAWRHVPALPFELAALPHRWFSRIGLPVVSYALPALIALGQVRQAHRPSGNPFTRMFRSLTRETTRSLLHRIQPSSGGYLEATPLTSFVVMSLISMGLREHPVVESGLTFLLNSFRTDGSWPIDTNLATWCTTLSVNALEGGDRKRRHLSDADADAIRDWLLGQQYQVEHPYTHAAPGGWAWTDSPGGVPDADDTSGALIALWHLRTTTDVQSTADDRTTIGAFAGVQWLLDVQNKDGGIPTFCRGWGKLPFDRSNPDLTAHAVRAWTTWRDALRPELRRRIDAATERAIRFLLNTQRDDGAWLAMWFGNQAEPRKQNPLYGTTRVLRVAGVLPGHQATSTAWLKARRRAIAWVLSAQGYDGGWGGAAGLHATVEETALAVEALGHLLRRATLPANDQPRAQSSNAILNQEVQDKIVIAVKDGCAWLTKHTDRGTSFATTPIGLYFANMWYYERLYPIIFTVSALEVVSGLRTTCLDGSPDKPSRQPARSCGL